MDDRTVAELDVTPGTTVAMDQVLAVIAPAITPDTAPVIAPAEEDQ